MKTKRILLVEDDSTLSREVVLVCAPLNIEVAVADDGETGFIRAKEENFDLVILDIQLPGRNGLDICRELRQFNPTVPIIILTTRGTELDRVLGFELGADDYVVKPFLANELLARVRAKLRMVETYAKHAISSASENSKHAYRDLELDCERRSVFLKGSPIKLTVKEFDLLAFLMRNPGTVFSKAELLSAVWDLEHAGYEDSVTSMVRRIRAKIEADSNDPQYILTAHGAGYSFAEERENSR